MQRRRDAVNAPVQNQHRFTLRLEQQNRRELFKDVFNTHCVQLICETMWTQKKNKQTCALRFAR